MINYELKVRNDFVLYMITTVYAYNFASGNDDNTRTSRKTIAICGVPSNKLYNGGRYSATFYKWCRLWTHCSVVPKMVRLNL